MTAAAPDSRWERVRALFDAAREVPIAQRAEWLTVHCGADVELHSEIERLLAASDRDDGFLDADARGLLAALAYDEDSDPRIGGRFGPYSVLRLLGAGGMGRVYLAQRSDGQFKQHVALKLIDEADAMPDVRGRFLREREILARLIHPHIAALHDGGIGEDGTPYFTLEYVDGETITRWCDLHRLGIGARVRLLLKVCDAVRYAHRNLVVHRDIKPGNVLVTRDGEPKLLDFGIAKLLGDDASAARLTATRGQPMTREYAAPEQVLAQPVTTATDVYAIGVLAYELCSGHLPYASAESGAVSWQKAIVEEVPESLERAIDRRVVADAASAAAAQPQPSDSSDAVTALAGDRGMSVRALKRALRGDLGRVVQRALEKNPDARYASVEALSDDLAAWLDRRPLRGSNWRYRIGKFLQRHWLPLAAVTAVALTLLVGASGVLWQARKADREARTTAEVKDFLVGLFSAVDPRASKGQDVRARELLDRGAQRIEHDLSDQPALQAELQSVLGRIYFQLGLYRQADSLQQKAIAQIERDGSRPLLAARTAYEHAATLVELGDFDGSAKAADAAIASLQALPQAPAADIVRALCARATAEINQRRFAQAAQFVRRALAKARAEHVDDAVLADALLIGGNATWGLPALDEAEADYRQALALPTGNSGEAELRRMRLSANLVMVLNAKSRYLDALSLAQQAVAMSRTLLGEEHPLTLHTLRQLGLDDYHLGHYRDARATLAAVIDAQRRILDADHPELAGSLIDYGLVLADDGAPADAEKAFGEAQGIWEKRYGHDYPGTVTALGDLGYAHLLQHRLDDAERELGEAIALDRKRGSPNPAQLARLGETKRQSGEPGAALALEREALDIARKQYGDGSRFAALAHYDLALACRDGGDWATSEAELRAALASIAAYLPQVEHPLSASIRIDLAELLAHRDGAAAERRRLLGEAVSIREKFFGADDPRTREARAKLAGLQTRG